MLGTPRTQKRRVGVIVIVQCICPTVVKSLPPGQAYPLEIYYQTGDIPIKEFGFDIPMKEFVITSNTDKAILIDDKRWNLRGNHLVNGDLVPWFVKVDYVPGSDRAQLV